MGSYYSKTTFEEFTIREKDTSTVADKNAYYWFGMAHKDLQAIPRDED